MTILLISGSLNPHSHAKALCMAAEYALQQLGLETTLVDLVDHPLPMCDGNSAYDDDRVSAIEPFIEKADAILIGVPIYNYDINAAVKNLVELTGSSWEGKTVGFLCAAGGYSSYMSVMSFVNSLMLDFRCLIIPRFIYAVGEDFQDHPDGTISISSPKIVERIHQLASETKRLAGILSSTVD